jgi:signal peptidase I
VAIGVDLTVELAAEILSATGSVRSVARGASMLPSIFPGDVLEIRTREFDKVRVGHVVLAMNGGHLCTHRVVREEVRCGERVLVTRGDALRFEDRQVVSAHEFLGCVELVVRRGRRFRPHLNGNRFHSALRLAVSRSSHARNFVVRFNSLLNFLAKTLAARPLTIAEPVARHS